MNLRLFLAALGASFPLTAALSPAGDADTPTAVDPRNYTDAEGTLLQGYLALPKHLQYEHAGDHAHEIGAHEGEDHDHFEWPPSPAVIFIHDADGANEYEQQRATIVARDQGYVGFAADIFGVFTERPAPDAPWSERAPFLGQFLNNATLFVQRMQAAVEYVQGLEEVDASKVAIVGYCMGGSGVVHYLNNMGETVCDGTASDCLPQIAGAISVHPSLSTDGPSPSGRITIPSLFLTGGSDGLTSPKSMAKLEADLTEATSEAGTPWESIRYAYILHAFSNWYSDNYDEEADARSWHASVTFFEEAFGEMDCATVSPAPGPEDGTVPVEYSDGNATLIGHVTKPPGITDETEPLPIVTILPNSMDGGYEKKRATEIATEQGYIAFVAEVLDPFEGKMEDAQIEMYHSDPAKYVSRIRAAIDHVKSDMSGNGGADPEKIAILGFGFGGSGALYYALTGDLVDSGVHAIASFHGDLEPVVESFSSLIPEETASPWGGRRLDDAAAPKVLVQSGAGDDESESAVQMEKILIGAGSQYEMSRFSNAEEMFTDWNGGAHDARASARSFDQLKTVLEEKFGPVPVLLVSTDSKEPPAVAPSTPQPTASSATSSFAASLSSVIVAAGIWWLL